MLLLIILRPCQTVTLPQERELVTIYERDTIVKDSIVYVSAVIPEPQEKVIISIDTIYKIDTTYIDTSSQVVRYYHDTIYQDNGILIWDALSSGELLALEGRYEGKLKNIIEYRDKEVKIKSRGLYMTSAIGWDFDAYPRASVGLLYQTRKGKLFGYEYDFINKTHSLATGLKLF